MMIFLKSQLGSIIASVFDFLLTFILVEWLGVWYGLASIFGNVSGATLNFSIGRYWSFDAKAGPLKTQAVRYTTVWLGYVILNFILLLLVKNIFSINYLIAKTVVAVILGLYNYLLQKTFVFKQS